ncbi:MAG: hypothetical protein WKF88_07030 [Ferruginibacter sp.]
MSKSNIVLAILAGAVIGGLVAIVLKAEAALEPEEDDGEEKPAGNATLENIARQFSDRISSDLKTAEGKLQSAVKKKSDFSLPEGEFGGFL